MKLISSGSTKQPSVTATPMASMAIMNSTSDAGLAIDAKNSVSGPTTASPSKKPWLGVPPFTHARSAGVDCTLTIFGQGPQRDTLASRIHALGLSDRVQLAGTVPHAQLMDAFAAADLLVHASALESFGMVMVEAMARGLPVVAAASAGVGVLAALLRLKG